MSRTYIIYNSIKNIQTGVLVIICRMLNKFHYVCSISLVLFLKIRSCIKICNPIANKA